MMFLPALIVVDFQNDFCPPNGSLAVAQGRNIAPIVNSLLKLPFVTKIATKDWHPQDHVSFASNHAPPNNIPFESTITIKNPLNESEEETTRLWPDHCVQGTPGAELVADLDKQYLSHIVEKGTDKRVEMYSAFEDPFRHPTVSKSNLAALLKAAGATHCYIVGLAYDYCVKYTALDAAAEGFVTYVVREGTKPVDPASIPTVEAELRAAGVKVVELESKEVARLRERPASISK